MSALERRTVTLTAEEWAKVMDVLEAYQSSDVSVLRRKIAQQLVTQWIGE